MSDVNQETQERDENKMIHLLDEDSMKSWVEFWSTESDNEVGQRIENWMSVLQGVKEVDVERANIWKCGIRWAVEARRKERGGEQEQNTGQEQGKQDKHVRFGQEEQQEETKAESTDEPEVTGRLAEVRTGRGSSDLVRGGDERCRADEISRKGKGKGNGGKGEHEGKGGEFGRKGKNTRRRRGKTNTTEKDTNWAEWRLTWGPVTHTPRPYQTQRRKKERRETR